MEYWKKRMLELEEENYNLSSETILKVKDTYLRALDYMRLRIDENTNARPVFEEKLENIKVLYKELAGEEIEETTNLYKGIINNTYTGITQTAPNKDLIKNLLKHNWSGKNYSERVWNNTKLLGKKAEEIITEGLTVGKSIYTMSEELRKLMTTGAYKAERLIRTESSFFYNQTALKAYKEYMVDEYEFLAKVDSRTSEICKELNGKKFKIEEAKVGVNYPPMHPFCRSTTIAFFG